MKLIKIKKILFLILMVTVILSTGCESINFDTFNTIEGSVGKGRATKGVVEAYDFNDKLLGVDTTIEDGRYAIDIGAYNGKIKLVAKLQKYEDEALEEEVEVDKLELEAYSIVDFRNLIVNISPLSNISVRLMNDINRTDNIVGINKYVSNLSGLGKVDMTKIEQYYFKKNQFEQADTLSNRKALILLSISYESNLTIDDNSSLTKTKVQDAMTKYYDFIIYDSQDNNDTKLNNFIKFIETESVTKTWIKVKAEDNVLDNTKLLDKNETDLIKKIYEKKYKLPIVKNFSTTIDENITSGTKIGKITFEKNGSAITSFTLTGVDNTKFKIDKNGTITTNSTFDYETKKKYNLKVLATNANSNSKSMNFDITIKNINDNAPKFTNLNTLSVLEDQVDAIILEANDLDNKFEPFETLTYSIKSGEGDADKFDINQTSGKVTFKIAPDFESGITSYSFKATVTDGMFSTTQDITIKITNI